MVADHPDIAIVGAGWAGLAAAITLSRAGKKVCVYESARQAGGRARCAPFAAQTVDNGQHLMLGAYSEMRRLLRLIGTNESEAFLRVPLDLYMTNEAGQHRQLRNAALPAPLDSLLGLLAARGYGWRDKWAIARLLHQLARQHWQIAEDTSVAQFLCGQPVNVNRWLWFPLCLAALNTPPELASARLFINTLRDSFAGGKGATDLLISRVDLARLFVQPAIDYIESLGGTVHLAQRVDAIEATPQTVTGLRCGERTVSAGQIILATPHYRSRALLEPHAGLAALAGQLGRLTTQPICTVYLQYPAHVTLGRPMQGLVGTAAQWLFDRRYCEQPGLIAVVISADGPHMNLDNPALVELVSTELAQQFPDWPPVQDSLVIREKRATFNCVVDVDRLRPANRTPLSGLWLAGDYTRTGYPATLEGAIRSGVQCAGEILEAEQDNHV